MRGAALYTWVRARASSLPPEAAPALCGQLDGPEAQVCQRRIHSAHLKPR